jgi:ferredoxin--NADP+ reductase
VAELAYQDIITKELPNNEFFGEGVRNKLVYYPTVTREPFRNKGRLTDLIENGKLFEDIGLPDMNIEDDRLMLCGSPMMLKDMRAILDKRGFVEGSHATPAHYVIEKAFVEQ